MRKIGLDILRALAVILILFRHSNLDNNLISHFGWLGVDLFFVLSGFLISNMLFVEHKKNKSIRVKRFLLRRLFKIFPPFYFFMLSTILYHVINNSMIFNWNQVLSEIFYLQNYLPNVWLHTWSLAVEEHFYLFISFTALFLSKKHLLRKKNILISSLLLLLVLSFMMRFYVSYPHRYDDFYGFTQTHLRFDGIITGILVSYLYNFTKWVNLILKRKLLMFMTAILLITPGFYFPGGGFFMNTIGLTLVNLGFSTLVLLSLAAEQYLQNNTRKCGKVLLKSISFIGVNSYSIYLWHLNSKSIIYLAFSYNTQFMTVMYILFSIIVGVIMSYIIEKPSIKLRDYTLNKISMYTNKYKSQ